MSGKIQLFNLINYSVKTEDIENWTYTVFNKKCKDINEDDINTLSTIYEQYRYLNVRINKDDSYKFFIDIDGTDITIDTIRDDLNAYFNNLYFKNGINHIMDFYDHMYYTKTNPEYKTGSYHIILEGTAFTCKELKAIVKDFIKIYPKYKNAIDKSIYTNHFFRLPNAIKGAIIKNG